MRKAHTLLLFTILAAAPAPAQPAPPPESPAASPAPIPADGSSHSITNFIIEYLQPNPNQPSAESLLDATVTLGLTPSGFVAPREGIPTINLRLSDLPAHEHHNFFDSALVAISPAVVRRLQELGLIGIYVEPHPEDLTVQNNQIVDLRPDSQTALRLRITTGIIQTLRTIGMGDYLGDADRINHPNHQRIIVNSPVGPASDDTNRAGGDLLRRDLIDDYVYRLNRHPGRRADVAVAPTGASFGAVHLDYIISENRPWFLYAQLSNTGTASTDRLRERFGFIHNQLTNNDDTLSVDYVTANFDSLNAVTASYEAPLGDIDRLRWRISAAWYEYTASDVGQVSASFDGRSWTAGAELIWNFFQNKDLFIDLVGGIRWEQTRVQDDLVGITGEDDFILPYAGIRFERLRRSERISGSVIFEANAPGLAGTDASTIDQLGRTLADEDWIVLRYDAAYSTYLEPLFAGRLEDDSTLAHEIAFTIRGQFAFNNRLIPNAEQVAGGFYSVRGYPEATSAGDDVFIASVEYRFHIPQAFDPEPEPDVLFGRPFRFAPQHRYGPTDWDLIFRAFIDFGRTVNSGRLPFEVDQTLVGAGVGLELALSRHFSARVDWGFALSDIEDATGRNEVNAGHQELHFLLTFVF